MAVCEPGLPDVLSLVRSAVEASAAAGIAVRFVMLPNHLAKFADDIRRETSLEAFASPRGDQGCIYVFAEDPRREAPSQRSSP